MCCIRDVTNLQFNKSIVLPESFLHDSIMCGIVADIDWDGINEIILGTYGKRLLIYKCRTTGPGVCMCSKSENSRLCYCVCVHACVCVCVCIQTRCLHTLMLILFIEDTNTFDLIWTRQFAYPLHCLLYEDITRDGLKELVALSTAGVHVLQV